MGVVTGNSWWVSLKHSIRYFATEYDRQLNLDKTREAKSIEDRLSRAVDGGDFLTVELARRDLERETSKRYQGFIVRSRLKRVLNEAVKSNVSAREEELRRFPDQYIGILILSSLRMGACCERMARYVITFLVHFHDRFPAVLICCFRSFAAILPTSPVLGRSKRLAARGRSQSSVRSGRAAPFHLLYVLALEPLLCRLRDEGANLALRGVPFAGPLTARVSAFADNITVFVSRRQDCEESGWRVRTDCKNQGQL